MTRACERFGDAPHGIVVDVAADGLHAIGICELGAGVHFPKSFQKFAMAESKKKFLEIYALWLYGQGVQEISLKSIVSVIRDPRSIARVRPNYHLRITIKT